MFNGVSWSWCCVWKVVSALRRNRQLSLNFKKVGTCRKQVHRNVRISYSWKLKQSAHIDSRPSHIFKKKNLSFLYKRISHVSFIDCFSVRFFWKLPFLLSSFSTIVNFHWLKGKWWCVFTKWEGEGRENDRSLITRKTVFLTKIGSKNWAMLQFNRKKLSDFKNLMNFPVQISQKI